MALGILRPWLLALSIFSGTLAGAQEAAAPDAAPGAQPASAAPADGSTAALPPEGQPQPGAAVAAPAAEVAPAGEAAPEPRAGQNWFALAGIVAFLMVFFGSLVWAIMAMEGAWFKAGRAAAESLGCAEPPYRNKTLTEDYEVHQWRYEDVPMLLETGSKIVAAPGAPTGAIPIMGATVTADLPKRLPYSLTVCRAQFADGRPLKTGDATFDEEVFCSSSSDEDARRLLADGGVRQAIRDLLQSDSSLPTVRGTVTAKAVEVQVHDRKRVREYCVKAAALARALSRRGESLAPAAPAAPAGKPAAPALPPADPSRPALGLDRAATAFPSWRVEGPVVFREEAIYFFISSLGYAPGEPGAGELLGAAGGLVGALAGAAVDKALRAAPERPAGLYFGSARDISERVGPAMAEAPSIVRCQEFFVVPRSDVQKVELDDAQNLLVMTAERAFTLSGDDMLKAKGFLAFRGYGNRATAAPPAAQVPAGRSLPHPSAVRPTPEPPPSPASPYVGTAEDSLPLKPAGAVQNAQDWLELAKAHMARNDLVQARRCYAQASERAPRLTEAWIGLGLCFSKAKQVEEAAKAFDRALKLEPKNGQALREKGRALLAGGLLGSALIELQEASAGDPSDTEAAELLYECRKRLGKL